MSITSHPLWRFSRAPAAQSQPSEQSAEGVLCSGTVLLRHGSQCFFWVLSVSERGPVKVHFARAHVRQLLPPLELKDSPIFLFRSEERRVGKECRSRWSAYHSK